MIFLISAKQRVSIELHVADKYPLVVLFTPPELDSRVKNFDPPQVFSSRLIGCHHKAVSAVSRGRVPNPIGND